MTDWITTSEAAELTGYERDHIRRLAANGAIKGQKFGRDWQVDRTSLLAYVKKVERLGEKRGPKKKED